MDTQALIHQARRWRLVDITVAAADALLVAGDALIGQFWLIALPAAIIPVMCGLAVWQTRRIGRFRAQLRRPDYAHIARMEREIYGETFSHDGAPEGGGWRVVGAASPGSIGAMRSGDVLYTLPWAIWGQAGALWLNANYPARAQPQGTASMRIERRPDGYHVWPPADNRYDLQPSAPFVRGAQGVRVAALHRPASPR